MKMAEARAYGCESDSGQDRLQREFPTGELIAGFRSHLDAVFRKDQHKQKARD
jgi:hypothetical protein